MASDFTATFLRDTVELLDILGRYDSAELPPDLEIARALHSLKSGAAFLGWDELETRAHELEESLKTDRGSDPVDWRTAAADLSEIVARRERAYNQRPRNSGSGAGVVVFDGNDRRILKDSRERNEIFYRLTCRIDPSEPFPRTRAYLISSKLETSTTLIRTSPPMDDSDGDFSLTSFWFTTDEPESSIFRIANIDLVEVVELMHLDYRDVLEGDRTPDDISVGHDADQSVLIVERERYEGTMEVVEELAWRLERRPGTPECVLVNELQKSLENLAFRPIEPMLTDMASAARRLADRRGIKVRFDWTLDSAGLEPASLESLGEILMQLVRNAVRHGIEPPEERIQLGKPEAGTLTLRLERSGKSFRFRFEDDGRGIDEDQVRQKAGQQGLPAGNETPILDILCHPGFSTADEADVDGGRGIGLEMIRHLLRTEFEGDLELENNPGSGLAVIWYFPEKHLRRPFLVIVSDGRKWAIPSDSVHRRGVVDPASISASGQGYAIAGGTVPILGPFGLRTPGDVKPYFVEIHHRGRRAALMVDDLLSEEPWGPADLVSADPASPWCRSLADAGEGIPILSPALVYAAEAGSVGTTGA